MQGRGASLKASVVIRIVDVSDAVFSGSLLCQNIDLDSGIRVGYDIHDLSDHSALEKRISPLRPNV